MKNFNQVPIIDLGITDKCKLAKQLINVSENVGFFYIINHGVDNRLCQNIMNISKEFFESTQYLKEDIALDK